MSKKIQWKKVVSSLVLVLAAACGGGSNPGNGNTFNGKTYSHQELADLFVQKYNADKTDNYKIQVAKLNTKQTGYAVVSGFFIKGNVLYFGATAVKVDDFNPNSDVQAFLSSSKVYHTLTHNLSSGNYEYEETWYGVDGSETETILFETDSQSTLNVEKAAKAVELAQASHIAEDLRESYGMSEEASMQTAAFVMQTAALKRAGTYDARAMDRFAKKLVGSSITEFQNDIKAGNTNRLQDRIEMAKEKTGLNDDGLMELFSIQ
jgi:hypothetical protein